MTITQYTNIRHGEATFVLSGSILDSIIFNWPKQTCNDEGNWTFQSQTICPKGYCGVATYKLDK